MADIMFLKVVEDFLLDHMVRVIVIVMLAWTVKRLGNILFDRLMRRLIRPNHFYAISEEDVIKRRDTVVGMMTTLWAVVVWAIALLMIVAEFGIDTGPVLASAGIVGIALGFGAQSVIKDFLSGTFIILENQYRVGDVVDLEGAAGTVEKITIRSTILRDVDGNVHYIPNGNVMHVINKTMGFSKVNLSVTVAADTDIDRLTELVNKVGVKMMQDEKWKDKLIDAPHFLSISSFTDTALEITVVATTQPSQQWAITGELRRRLLETLHKNHVELAHLLPVNVVPSYKK